MQLSKVIGYAGVSVPEVGSYVKFETMSGDSIGILENVAPYGRRNRAIASIRLPNGKLEHVYLGRVWAISELQYHKRLIMEGG